jgi:hypothetical protein
MTLIRCQRFLFFLIPVVIFFSYLFLAIQPDLGIAIPELVGICGWIIILLAICQFNPEKKETINGIGFNWSPMFILSMAAVFRCMFVWRTPELSDDIYRYLLDGLMMAAGNNPYAEAPASVSAILPQMSGIIPLINHPQLTTIYPPAAQVVFAAGVLLGKLSGFSILMGMKLLLAILDLMSCAIIIKLLTILHLSKKRSILYAWHPLPVIEIAASGHIDSAAIFFLTAAIALVVFTITAERQKRGRFYFNRLNVVPAGILMALAILTKWLPLIFMPGLWLTVRPGQRRYFLFGCLIAAGCLTWPFMPEFVNGLKTLNTYLQNWEFSGFVFRQLRHVTGSGDIARLLLGGSLFIIIAGLFIWHRRLEKTILQMFKVFYVIAFGYLVLTPTMHPWYALYLVVLLPFAGSGVLALAGLTLSWSVILAYRVLIAYRLTGFWIEDDTTAFMVVLAPAVSFLSVTVVSFIYRHLRIQVD